MYWTRTGALCTDLSSSATTLSISPKDDGARGGARMAEPRKSIYIYIYIYIRICTYIERGGVERGGEREREREREINIDIEIEIV